MPDVVRWLGVFFFSSRRRHTRLQGDWSSDVCSSDLHMIDDYLIETNMTDVTIDVTDDEINAEMRKFGPSSDFPLAKIREAVRLRIRMQKYFDKRWGESIHPADDDIRRYYESVFVPAAKDRGLTSIPSLESIADSVR